jgi:hypothetical protein
VSDAHSSFEVGVAYTAFDHDPSTPAGLLAGLPTADLVLGRASLYVRLWTPIAKAVQRARGNAGDPRPAGRPIAAGGPVSGLFGRAVRHGTAGRQGAPERRRAPGRRGAPPEAEPASAAIAGAERRSGIDRRHADDRRTGESISARSALARQRLRQPRTLISLILPLFLLVLLYRALPGFHLDQLPALIAQANLLYLLGHSSCSISASRSVAWRWAILIRADGFRLKVATGPRSSSSAGS